VLPQATVVLGVTCSAAIGSVHRARGRVLKGVSQWPRPGPAPAAKTPATSKRSPAAKTKAAANRKRTTTAPRPATAVDKTKELSEEVLDSLEKGQRTAIEAVRKFVDTVDHALPALPHGER
jgi:hypothetical protein